MPTAIHIEQDHLEKVCERWHIRKLSIFGSALRDDFRPNSDIDVLVEFDPEHIPGWEIVDIGEDLPEVFGGRYVDIVDPKFLLPGLKDGVLSSAVVRYERP